uniref:Uncharacterized protein n=1 Tax=Anopheles maculatus TaxID=74869 RepID=A0A182TCN9_9DIPT
MTLWSRRFNTDCTRTDCRECEATSAYLKIEFSILVHGGDIGRCFLEHVAFVPSATEAGQRSSITLHTTGSSTIVICTAGSTTIVRIARVTSQVITYSIGDALLSTAGRSSTTDRIQAAP